MGYIRVEMSYLNSTDILFTKQNTRIYTKSLIEILLGLVVKNKTKEDLSPETRPCVIWEKILRKILKIRLVVGLFESELSLNP